MSPTQQILDKLKSGELESPNALSNYLVQLSASLLSAGGFELEARIAYSKKWIEIKQSITAGNNEIKQKSDKQTDMEAMATGEYKLWQQMFIANRAMLETIRSLKKRLKAMEIEAQLS